MSTGRAIFRVLGWAGGAWLTMSCSLLYQPAEQCNVDSDCIRLARTVPALKGSLCLDHACSLPEAMPHDCETNSYCIEAAQGKAAVCRDFQCVNLISEGCRLALNEQALTSARDGATSDDVILLGALERFGSSGATMRAGLASYELAADQMQARVHGAIGNLKAPIRRPFVFVVCDNALSGTLDSSFDHLTKVLKVPVVVTTLQPRDLYAQWVRLRQDSGFDTMIVNAFAWDSSIDFFETSKRIWSMLGDPVADLGPVYVKVVKNQLDKVKVAAGPAHVLMITSDYPVMADIANLIEPTLPFTDLAGAIDSNFYRRVGVSSSGSSGVTDTSEVSRALIEVEPDVVIVLGGEELIQSAIVGNETNLPPTRASSVYYVLSHHLSNSPKLLLEMSNIEPVTDTSLDKRLLGINYAGAADRTLYNTYLSSLRSKYGAAVSEGFENYYDAAYYAMLSVLAIAPQWQTSALNGTKAVQGFNRITDMAPAATGYSLISKDLTAIARALEFSDDSISVTGTMGPPDFSPTTGARRSDASVWCYRQNSLSGALEWSADAVRFSWVGGEGKREGQFNQEPDSCQRVQ